MDPVESQVWMMLLTRLQEKSVTFNIQLSLFVSTLPPVSLSKVPVLLDAIQPG